MNDEQRANLKKLADYLAIGKTAMEFSMADFCLDDEGRSLSPKEAFSCGTVGCALGHGPAAGVPFLRHRDWWDYAEHQFGLEEYSDEWDWCFAGVWAPVDNTPQGAAARIYYLLEHGRVPPNVFEMQIGRAPLCYSTEGLKG